MAGFGLGPRFPVMGNLNAACFFLDSRVRQFGEDPLTMLPCMKPGPKRNGFSLFGVEELEP